MVLSNIAEIGSSGFTPITSNLNAGPRYKSTAYAEGVLYDPDTGIGIVGATGKMTLYLNGTAIFTDRPMTKATTQLDGWVRCIITDVELGAHGLYQWRIVLTDTTGTFVLTDTGTFTI